jgi:hypothetical protein
MFLEETISEKHNTEVTVTQKYAASWLSKVIHYRNLLTRHIRKNFRFSLLPSIYYVTGKSECLLTTLKYVADHILAYNYTAIYGSSRKV